MRNYSGATQKTKFIDDVSLVRNNKLHQSTAISSDGKSPSTSDSKKKQKNDPTHCRSRITGEKKSKQGSNEIHCYDKQCHAGNVNLRTKMKESSSCENNFSELALQQNMLELNTKKIKPKEI